MKRADIKIDMDKKCSKCGQPGALPSGICMKCATDMLDNPPFGDKATDMIHTQVDNLLDTWTGKINQAIYKNENKLDVTFTVHLQLFSTGAVAVKTDIGFTFEKVKDGTEVAMVSENQEELPLE